MARAKGDKRKVEGGRKRTKAFCRQRSAFHQALVFSEPLSELGGFHVEE
jgi:hypothetical protein